MISFNYNPGDVPTEFTLPAGEQEYNVFDKKLYTVDPKTGRILLAESKEQTYSGGGKNKLINGGFDIWQRGNSGECGQFCYSADRWEVQGGGTSGYQYWERLNTGSDGRYKLGISRSGEGTGGMYIVQKIEAININNLVGKTVTLDLEASSSDASPVTIRIYTPSSGTDDVWGDRQYVDDIQEYIKDFLNGSTKSFSFVVPDNAKHGLAICVSMVGDTSQEVSLYLYSAQLEEGSVVTLFEQLPIEQIWGLCHKYYWQGNLEGNAQGEFYMGQSDLHAHGGTISFHTRMRVSPTITILEQPIYDNCTHDSFISSPDAFMERVTITDATIYRAYSGIYSADAEI